METRFIVDSNAAYFGNYYVVDTHYSNWTNVVAVCFNTLDAKICAEHFNEMYNYEKANPAL